MEHHPFPGVLLTMTLLAFFLILLSVFLHVTWNLLSKKVAPSLSFYVLMSYTAALIWLPFFLCSDLRFAQLPPRFFAMLAGSICGEVIYMIGLGRAYRKGDISLVYPVVRALPVMMIAVLTLALGIGKPFGGLALGGMVLITLGCFLMPLRGIGGTSFRSLCRGPVLFFILLSASGTTMYTIFDKCALEIVAAAKGGCTWLDAVSYLFCVELSQATVEFCFVLADRRDRRIFKRLAGRSIYPSLAGCCSTSAYALILMAMRYVTNVSYLQAFRQISLPLGFLAGVVLLREKALPVRIVGLVFILVGLVIVALG